MTRRAGLDTRLVIDAAADLVDAEGVDALTLAKLAERLDVRIPSLYNHVAGLAGLRRALALRAIRGLADALARAAVGKASDAAVFAMADAYRAYEKAHPGLYAMAQRIPAGLDEEMRKAESAPVEVVLAVLDGYGLSGEDAIHAVRAIRSAIHGFLTLEATGGFGLNVSTDESFHRLIALLVRGLREQSADAHRSRV